jgi:FkbM family methyltransferase
MLNPEYARGVVRALLSPKDKLLTFKVGGRPVRIRPPSFIAQYRDIFLDKEYDFRTTSAVPRILDIGANMGFSCIFFKSIYPNSQIEGFEADPEIYAVLTRNLRNAGYPDIVIHNQAVWIKDGEMKFQPNGLGGGQISASESATVTVKTIDLKTWLQGKTFDLIKMDIEGAENSVIPHCINEIAGSARFIFEYHSHPDEPQKLADILVMLRDHGFRVYLKTCNPLNSPLRRTPEKRGTAFDNMINVFAERPGSQ